MDGHLRHLHCHYRVLGERDSAPQISAHLTRVLQAQVMEVYERALDEVFADDPAVHVIRALDTRVSLALNDHANDAQLAGRWGARLAAQVIRRIANASEGDEGVIRFADQADYISCFISDLIEGRVASRWYYGAFDYLKGRSTGDTVRRVLADNRAHLGRTFTLLRARGLLGRVLHVLDAHSLHRLWTEVVRQQALPLADGQSAQLLSAQDRQRRGKGVSQNTPRNDAADAQKDRALFDQVLHFLARAQLRVMPGVSAAQLFAAYRPQCIVDWSDTQALSQGACDVLDFMQAQGQIKAFSSPLGAEDLTRLEQAIERLDWLHTQRLRDHLFALLIMPKKAVVAKKKNLTPRQQQLITAISTSLASEQDRQLAVLPTQLEAIALRLYAGLLEQQAQWADDTLAQGLIEALARIQAALQTHPDAPTLRALRRAGQLPRFIQLFSDNAPAALRAGLALVEHLGPSAWALLDALDNDVVVSAPSQLLSTRCAGIFLLLRAVNDMRLSALAGSLIDLDILLISLFMRIAGEGVVVGGRIDAGLSVFWRGPREEGVNELDVLRTAWAGVEREQFMPFQYAILGLLSGQRLLRAEVLHLYKIQLADGCEALVGGDSGAQLWPLVCVLEEGVDVASIVSQWAAQWRVQTRVEAALIVADASLSGMCGQALMAPPYGAGDACFEDERIEAHRQGRERLTAALHSLAANTLGIVQADLQCASLALSLVRVWARWLNRFSDAGAAYLLDKLIRREGQLCIDVDTLAVVLDPAPLDVVIEMAGYCKDLERLDFIAARTTTFSIRR